jgi:hypothetical protein
MVRMSSPVPCISTTDACVTRTAPAGWQLTGFHGRSGAEVDKLGFIYTRAAAAGF